MPLNARSVSLLASAHPDLRRVVIRAYDASTVPFTVTETLRTIEKQKALKDSGASQTMRSRHLPSSDGLSRAVDLAALVGGMVRWDWPLYDHIAAAMKAAAAAEGVPIEWGGDWGTFKDGLHFQLPWKDYP